MNYTLVRGMTIGKTTKKVTRKGSRPKRVLVVFIVNGVEVPVSMNSTDLVKSGRDQALNLSYNIGRPADEWEIHNSAGDPIDPDGELLESGVNSGDWLFLNLGIGVGGDKVVKQLVVETSSCDDCMFLCDGCPVTQDKRFCKLTGFEIEDGTVIHEDRKLPDKPVLIEKE
jgi:hypothetical protein